MVDRQMLDFLVRTASVSSDEVVVEVGTGAGFLTERLCRFAGWVISVEIDAGLFELACERLEEVENLTLIHGDAMAGEHCWSDPVRRAISDALAARPGGALKLVANLPYAVATSTVQAILEADPGFHGAYFTCQKEVADRLIAPPGSGDYGFISVLTALLADVRVVRKLPPSVFWPRPKVESAIVEMLTPPDKLARAGDLARLRQTLSMLFSQRRKELPAVLKGLNLDPGAILNVREALGESGIPLKTRVFRLDPEGLKLVAGALFSPAKGR